jgi:hypothetical protein
VIFFKTRQPVEPVSFIQRICQDVVDGVEQKRCRFVKRLTPITAIDKATERGLDEVAKSVLAPHFHGPDQTEKKVNICFCVGCRQMMCGRVAETLVTNEYRAVCDPNINPEQQRVHQRQCYQDRSGCGWHWSQGRSFRIRSTHPRGDLQGMEPHVEPGAFG